MPELKGFFIIRIGDEYFVNHNERTNDREKAYAFMLKHCAIRLAEKLGGVVEMV